MPFLLGRANLLHEAIHDFDQGSRVGVPAGHLHAILPDLANSSIFFCNIHHRT